MQQVFHGFKIELISWCLSLPSYSTKTNDMNHLASVHPIAAPLTGEVSTASTLPPRRNQSLPCGDTPPPGFISLADETRHTVDTACAAYHLGRKAQTLRIWACRQLGGITPVRCYGRLAWPVADLRRMVGMV